MPGLIVFQGQSEYDGSPIVSILIKASGKGNKKTGGDVIQQYIIRSDVDPLEASRSGGDFAVCGNCKHRGKPSEKPTGEAIGRTCYVTLHHAPLGVYKAFKRGSYPVAQTIGDVMAFINGGMIRLGAYGDPASVPDGLNKLLIECAGGHTAYTHGFSVSDELGDTVAPYAMVSADSKAEAIRAHSRGYRTFRVIPISQSNEALLNNEIMCPSPKVLCQDCRLCKGGNIGKSIAIIAHGKSKNKVS